ncbi:MAG TPA: hypothetical protein PLA80_13875, partial [Synergistaceae bacterium]|nr:hypothetical protein [Synergistaceae bacterium]
KVDALLKAVTKCATEWGPLWICWHSPGIHNPLCFFSPLMAERHKNLWGTDPVEEIERYTQKLPEQISSNSYLLDCFWENRESLLHYITFSVELFGITEIFYIYRERLFQNFDEEFFRPLLRATESKQYLDTIAAMRYKNSDTYDEKKVLDTLEGLVDLSYRQLTYNIPCSNNFTILPCFEKQKTSMQIQPTWGWLPTLWAKVLAAIVHDRKIFVCDFCGEIYTREVMPRQGHKRRCPKCRFAK